MSTIALSVTFTNKKSRRLGWYKSKPLEGGIGHNTTDDRADKSVKQAAHNIQHSAEPPGVPHTRRKRHSTKKFDSNNNWIYSY